jgi:hypothetical protein
MALEIRLKGSPTEFRDMVNTFAERIKPTYGHRLYSMQAGQAPFSAASIYSHQPSALGAVRRDQDINIVRFDVHSTDQSNRTKGEILAQRIPTGTMLIVSATDADWPAVQSAWDILHAELIRQGWITTPTQDKQAQQSHISQVQQKTERARSPATDIKWQGIYNRAKPLVESGITRERIAEQLDISIRTLRDILKWGKKEEGRQK